MNYEKSISKNFKGINDSTLREGEQYNSSVFSLNDQKGILEKLYIVGVDTAEVGNPIVPEINKDLKLLTKVKQRPPLMAHIRNNESDLLAAIDAKVNGVHILCTADLERLALMHITLQEHIDYMTKNVRHAQSLGFKVRVSVEHGLEVRFLSDAMLILKAADTLKVDRVQVADTRGVLFPWNVEGIIKSFRKEIKTAIGVHFHNDMGHAVGNAILALGAGANWVDTTMLGIGERTGITPLSTLLVNLSNFNQSIVYKYNLAKITMVEQWMANKLGMQVPHNLISSPTAFSHKAGIHLTGIKKQGTVTYEAFDPGLVGNERVIVTSSRISGKK